MNSDDTNVKIAFFYLLGEGIIERKRSEETLRLLVKADVNTIREEAVRALRRLVNMPF